MFSANSSQVSDDKLFVEDVFSTYLVTGNGGITNIVNNINLRSNGGLVWSKSRATGDHYLQRASGSSFAFALVSNSTAAQTASTAYGCTSNYTNGIDFVGDSGVNYSTWTFRKAPKFFDVVTYTGDGNSSTGDPSPFGRGIAHSLGIKPGFVVIKRTDASGDWRVAAQKSGSTEWFRGSTSTPFALNGTNGAEFTMNGTTQVYATATDFYPAQIGGSSLNESGATYVAYLFAHDTTSDGIIQCGSFTTDGSGLASVTLGYEPQWILVKRADGLGNWTLLDAMRGLDYSSNARLFADLSQAESFASAFYVPTATGFNVVTSLGASRTFIYIAIRRGPMRTPTSGTSVYTPALGQTSSLPNFQSNSFPVDLATLMWRSGSENKFWFNRLTSPNYLTSNTINAELTDGSGKFDYQNGWYSNLSFDSTWVSHQFRRAPSFMDVVCYTGTGVNGQTYSHNLGVIPELMIVKRRNAANSWLIYSASVGATNFLAFDGTTNSANPGAWNNTAPTASVFTVGTFSNVNASGSTYVAYLFASCPGVSKVGSYTGNGSSQTINCGFAAGARFVMIKRTDSTGDWYVWDTARGIVAGNDPRLSLNSTAAEVTTDDSVDTDSSGFVVNQLSATNINVSSATYIYLAVA